MPECDGNKLKDRSQGAFGVMRPCIKEIKTARKRKGSERLEVQGRSESGHEGSNWKRQQ